jgi:hypothetical protein
MQEPSEEIFESLERLVGMWCDRRCYIALRQILHGYPVASLLTDELADLLEALKGVRAFAKDEITDDEAAVVNRLIGVLSHKINR